ncbi:MAG TPA: hypothetical protein VME66_02475 [Candidatus Acidoferrales bacterium]|nr:hypothetical protein [Candidatus Acidoferrales bacterium]
MALVLDASVALRWFLADEQRAAAGALRDLPILVDPPGHCVLRGSEVRLARFYGMTSYDAAYLALAADRQVPLATFDAALAHAARDLGVVVLEQ